MTIWGALLLSAFVFVIAAAVSAAVASDGGWRTAQIARRLGAVLFVIATLLALASIWTAVIE